MLNISADKTFVGGGLSGRTFSTSAFGGELISYEISDASLENLWRCVGAVFECLNGKNASEPAEQRAIRRGQLLRERHGY